MSGNMLESSLLETHFDVIPFGIYVVDVATLNLIFVNRHFRDRLGDLAGRRCHEAIYESPQPCLFCKIRNLVDRDGLPNGKTYIFEHFNDKDDRWYQLQEKSMSWPDGRVVKYSIAVDITELKEVQNRLAEAHAELALKNRELSRQNELLQENVRLREHVDRIARHDLKTPLNALIGIPPLLPDYGLNAEGVKLAHMMEEAGITMLNMINRTFDLYRLETGTYHLRPVEVNLVAVARKAAQDVAADVFFADRPVRVLFQGRPAADGDVLAVQGEELLCYSMLSNLVKNAVEASPPGQEITVSLDRVGDEAVVSIHNAGEVPEDIRGRFFQKYVTSGKRDGTGLGAYSAMLAVTAHGGRASLDASRPGFTTVTVCFPVPATAAASEGGEPPQ
ncbi:histidine kinase [Desulfovibrio sulfodismutans]|uniref:histidine kinase n=2 Tax=Desulfolutivibrio sulfodismutans TaxID=63561 RepID=A0A7K3NL59_9BACT|nr:histidine kinase [Desulfolutivibrio sulfodismutans]QLA12605.1 histidine kinase [Desulfolutivibrio sulfodismutans DSM 3696]